MKISDIIVESEKPELTGGQVRQLFADNPELMRFIIQAYQSPQVKDWGMAIDVGTMRYQTELRKKNTQNMRTNVTPPESPKVPPITDFKRGADNRVLRHKRYYTKGKTAAIKNKLQDLHSFSGDPRFSRRRRR